MAPLCGMPFVHDGDLVYDGAVSDWFHNGLFTAPKGHQSSKKKEISVTPFWFSRADIKPSQYIPLWWALYPPRVEDFEWVYHLGCHDGKVWSMQQQESLDGQITSDILLHKFAATDGKPKGAFTRSFGYRSILRLVPSSAFDMLLWLIILIVVKPCAIWIMYMELFLRCLLHPDENKRKRSRVCASRLRLPFDVLTCQSRFRKQESDGQNKVVVAKKELFEQSFVFRVCIHFLEDKDQSNAFFK